MSNEINALPEDLNPLNLHAYLANNFGICGCVEHDTVIESLVRLLEWHEQKDRPKHDELYPEVGVYYLLSGQLDRLDLNEHGTSVRYPWLSSEGKRLLHALKTTDAKEIENAHGVAYDGIHY